MQKEAKKGNEVVFYHFRKILVTYNKPEILVNGLRTKKNWSRTMRYTQSFINILFLNSLLNYYSIKFIAVNLNCFEFQTNFFVFFYLFILFKIDHWPILAAFVIFEFTGNRQKNL